jgi:hypothetical protein
MAWLGGVEAGVHHPARARVGVRLRLRLRLS